MALIKTCRGFTPQISDDVWLAENSTIIGDVSIESGSSIWFNAVIRGDVNKITIGNNVNIQDGAVLHCTFEKTQLVIGDNVSIGHNALVHGCQIHDNVLIGMGAIVMDNAIIESGSIVAAGAVILENMVVPSGSVYAGIPAKKVKNISKELFEGEVHRIAKNYRLYASWFK